MGKLSSYVHASTLTGTELVPIVVTPGIVGGNAYITADELAAATPLTERYATVINVQDPQYGAVLDGVADDTAAIQAAIDDVPTRGRSLVTGFAGKTASVTQLVARSGLTIDLDGGTLKASSATPTAVIKTPGWGGGAHIDDFTVINGTIDLNSLVNCGVIIKDATRCTVDRVKFVSIKDSSSGTVNLNENTSRCRVTNCTITMTIAAFGALTSMPGIQCVSAITDIQGGGQNATLTFDTPTNLSQLHAISGNTIIGGTHGVVLFAAAKCLVVNNNISSQTDRSIILSPVACDNTIEGNTCVDFISTGIHMAWGCLRNTIKGNTVLTSVSAVEGNGIKGYYGCSNNNVVGNTVVGTLFGGIRFAVGSVSNSIVGNLVVKCMYGIHIENALITGAYYVPASLPSADGNSIIGNTIDGTGAPAFCVGILLSTANTATIRHTLLASNLISGVVTGVRLEEPGGGSAVNNIRAFANMIEATTGWTTGRGLAHFVEVLGNGTGLANKFAASGTSIPQIYGANGANLDLILAAGNAAGSINFYNAAISAINLQISDAGNITLRDATTFNQFGATGSKIGGSATQKFGFWGATPVVRPTATPAAATDLATALTLLNDIRTKLVTVGLIS